MPSMPETMAKGPILDALDEALSTPHRREKIFGLLKAEPEVPLATIAAQGGIVQQGSEEERHLRDDWFGTLWWPQIDPSDRDGIVRAGLIRAIELARPHNLRVDCYWVCHPGDHSAAAHDSAGPSGALDTSFEACVCFSDKQVTLFLHTPEPPPMPAFVGDPIFVVKKVGSEILEKDMQTGTTVVV